MVVAPTANIFGYHWRPVPSDEEVEREMKQYEVESYNGQASADDVTESQRRQQQNELIRKRIKIRRQIQEEANTGTVAEAYGQQPQEEEEGRDSNNK